jgi:hypothetical protein
MITTFTEIDLIRYLYGESSDNEKTDIENALICDPELEEKYSDLTLNTSLLDCLFFDPSEITLEKIFSFSSNFSLNQKIS